VGWIAWFWSSYGPLGAIFAGLCAAILFAFAAWLAGLARQSWQTSAGAPQTSAAERATPPQAEGQVPFQDIFGSPTITQSPPTLQASLYVGDIRFNFAELTTDRHSDLTMRVFNGSGRIVELANVSGQLKLNAPNNTDPTRMGTLPTPAVRHDTARTIAQLQEWFLILSQRVPAKEADKLLAMLENKIPILFDLSELNIEVFPKNDPEKIERLPIWAGLSFSPDTGYCKILAATVDVTLG
jgi:hypothetical protein